MLAIAATSTLSVLPPLFIGGMIDALTQHNFANVMRELGLFAIVTVAYGITQIVEAYSTSIFRETLARNLRVELVKKLDRVTFDALSTRTPGEINNRVTSDIEALCVQFQYTLFPGGAEHLYVSGNHRGYGARGFPPGRGRHRICAADTAAPTFGRAAHSQDAPTSR